MVYSTPEVWGLAWLGTLLESIAELPRCRMTASRWNIWLTVSDSSWPVCLARALASLFSSITATGCHPPRLSAASGTKTMPCCRHSSAARANFSAVRSSAGGLVSTNSGLGASVTGALDSSVTTVAGVSFVSVCLSGLSVTNVYIVSL